MQTRLLTAEFLYDGSQLRSGWIAETAGLTGDAAVAFLGPCDVSFEHMVDRVDLEAGARIASPRMVHVIVEHPGLELAHITTRQRLLMALALELLNAKLGEACFTLGAISGDTVAVKFDPRCADAAVLARLDANPPAGLYASPPARQKAVVKNPDVLRRLTTI